MWTAENDVSMCPIPELCGFLFLCSQTVFEEYESVVEVSVLSIDLESAEGFMSYVGGMKGASALSGKIICEHVRCADGTKDV